MVDSADGENELAPFRNVMNEMYARDISRKVRSTHRIRGNSGEPLSQPPYGYMKSPENKKRWIIDPEASGVVREIFKMYLEGKGIEMIARELQERQVLVPQAYWTSKGLSRSGKKTQSNPYKWCKTTISKILAQQEYAKTKEECEVLLEKMIAEVRERIREEKRRLKTKVSKAENVGQ